MHSSSVDAVTAEQSLDVPLVSVIMPVYNESDGLCESIDSFLAQSVSNRCELICVDDGSSDDSLERLQSYAAVHPSTIRVVSQKNQGSGKARNHGISIARGAFIGFLDADDLYPSDDVLETLYHAAIDHGLDIAGGSMIMFNDDFENRQFAGIPGFSGHQFLEDGIVSYRDYQFDYGYQRFIFKTAFLHEHNLRFPDYLRYQDPPFFVQAMIAAGSFYAVKMPTYKYRTAVKKVHWTQRKIIDLIAAIQDIGCMAEREDLFDLFSLNLSRFCDNQRTIIEQFVLEGNVSVLTAMVALRNELLQHVPNETYANEVHSSFSPISQLERVSAEYRASQLEQDELACHIKELEKSNQALLEEYVNAQENLKVAEQRVSDILASTSWKIGQRITFLPGKVKRLILQRR